MYIYLRSIKYGCHTCVRCTTTTTFTSPVTDPSFTWMGFFVTSKLHPRRLEVVSKGEGVNSVPVDFSWLSSYFCLKYTPNPVTVCECSGRKENDIPDLIRKRKVNFFFSVYTCMLLLLHTKRNWQKLWVGNRKWMLLWEWNFLRVFKTVFSIPWNWQRLWIWNCLPTKHGRVLCRQTAWSNIYRHDAAPELVKAWLEPL